MNTDKPSDEITRLIKAFGYSLQGLRFGMRQRAFQLEVIVGCFAIPAAIALGENGVERALLIGSIFLVMIVELLNSAVEAAIDRISAEQHTLSGMAKDMASAAVLLSIINATIIWLAVLW